jgi:hypothetical protein
MRKPIKSKIREQENGITGYACTTLDQQNRRDTYLRALLHLSNEKRKYSATR